MRVEPKRAPKRHIECATWLQDWEPALRLDMHYGMQNPCKMARESLHRAIAQTTLWAGQGFERQSDLLILSEMKRLADPYRDLDVIDSRAPRFNQATVGTLSALAVATGWWWLLAALGMQLAVGLTFGRRFCLPCLVYFELVQPRYGEGMLEDSRPPRFANMGGAAMLLAASAAYALGASVAGMALGSLIATLALLAAATGFCAGCEAFKLGSFLLGRPFVSCPIPGTRSGS
jgi:hypothetical protein